MTTSAARLAFLTLFAALAPAFSRAQSVQPQSIIVTGTGPAVMDFTLINADNNQPVPGYDPIQPGAVLDLSKLPPRLSVRANTLGKVGSVRFGYDGNDSAQVQNGALYTLCGDNGANNISACGPKTFAPGAHRLTATAYTGQNGGGTPGTGIIVNFSVARPAAARPRPAVTSLTLIDADTDRPVRGFDPIPAGAVLRLSQLPRHLNVRANVSGKVGSVRFRTNQLNQVQSGAPFSLCNDDLGNYFTCGPNVFSPGTRTVTATPFAETQARGVQGQTLTWNFTVER